jgi:hypothetical protein
VELAGAGLGGGAGQAGIGKAGPGKPIGETVLARPTFLRAPEGQNRAGPGVIQTGRKRAIPALKTGQESAQRAQPSGADGVPEDMATLVLDKSAWERAG